MEKEFVIPEKWYLEKVDSREKSDVVSEYARGIGGHHWLNNREHTMYHYLHVENGLYLRGKTEPEKGFTKITYEQFEKHILKTNKKEEKMNKTIKGYILKPGMEMYRAAVETILSPHYTNIIKNLSDNMKNEGYLIGKSVNENGTSYEYHLKQAGVLDLWFTPVYREDKIKTTLSHSKGTMGVEISKGFIEVIGERTFTIAEVKKLLASFKTLEVGAYDVNVKYINIGCKENIQVADIQNLVKQHDEAFS